jgi:hypothetical protein
MQVIICRVLYAGYYIKVLYPVFCMQVLYAGYYM